MNKYLIWKMILYKWKVEELKYLNEFTFYNPYSVLYRRKFTIKEEKKDSILDEIIMYLSKYEKIDRFKLEVIMEYGSWFRIKRFVNKICIKTRG